MIPIQLTTTMKSKKEGEDQVTRVISIFQSLQSERRIKSKIIYRSTRWDRFSMQKRKFKKETHLLFDNFTVESVKTDRTCPPCQMLVVPIVTNNNNQVVRHVAI